MDLKKAVSPIILFAAFVLFGCVCVIVWFSGGKSTKWITRKIKIGAFILTLTSVTSGCDLVATCYDQVADYEYVSIVGQGSIISVDSQDIDSYTIKGTIFSSKHNSYLYRIFRNEDIIDEGLLTPDDGDFNNESEENFTCTINENLEVGEYRLVFFGDVKANAPLKIDSFHLIVK